MLGNGRVEAQCFDGEKRLAHIRGKMRKKVNFGQNRTTSLGSSPLDHFWRANPIAGLCHLNKLRSVVIVSARLGQMFNQGVIVCASLGHNLQFRTNNKHNTTHTITEAWHLMTPLVEITAGNMAAQNWRSTPIQ